MNFSDVFADRRLPEELSADPLLYAECLGGAMYRPDLLSLARRHGFLDPRVVSEAPIEITSEEISARVGAAMAHDQYAQRTGATPAPACC